MNEYKHGDWYCKPANEAEAREIIERAVASGAENIHGFRGNSSRITYGVPDGIIKGEAYKGDEYTMQKVRELFPLPGEQQEQFKPVAGLVCEVVRNGYVLSEHGEGFLGVPVTIHAVFTNANGTGMAAVGFEDGDCACFRLNMLRPIRSERERWVESVEAATRIIGATNAIGLIYDALKSGALKAPEVNK